MRTFLRWMHREGDCRRCLTMHQEPLCGESKIGPFIIDVDDALSWGAGFLLGLPALSSTACLATKALPVVGLAHSGRAVQVQEAVFVVLEGERLVAELVLATRRVRVGDNCCVLSDASNWTTGENKWRKELRLGMAQWQWGPWQEFQKWGLMMVQTEV